MPIEKVFRVNGKIYQSEEEAEAAVRLDNIQSVLNDCCWEGDFDWEEFERCLKSNRRLAKEMIEFLEKFTQDKEKKGE